MKRLLLNGTILLMLLTSMAGIKTGRAGNKAKTIINLSEISFYQVMLNDTIPQMKMMKKNKRLKSDTTSPMHKNKWKSNKDMMIPSDSLIKNEKRTNLRRDASALDKDSTQGMKRDTTSHPMRDNMPMPPTIPVNTSGH